MLRGGLAFVFLIVLGACASSPSVHLNADKVVDSKRAFLELEFPEAEFITTWGESRESQRDAELDAKSRISEQITSSIKAETKSVASAWMKNGQINDEQFLQSTISTESRFDRAELVHFSKEMTGPDGKGGYRAYAYLNRAELGLLLAETYEDNAVIFRSQVASALVRVSNPLGFTAPWLSAKKRFEKMFAMACQYRAVLRHSPSQFDLDRQLLHDLELARAELLADLIISIDLSLTDEIDTPAMNSALTGALLKMGLDARIGNCTDGGTFHLILEPEVTWNTIMGTRFCQVRLVGKLQECSDRSLQKPIVIEGSVMEGRGVDPIRSLARRVTAESLQPLVTKSLSNVLPISEVAN